MKIVLKEKRAPDTRKKKMVPRLKTQELIIQRSELIFSAKLPNLIAKKKTQG